MKKRTTFSVVPWYFTIPSLIGLALILGPLLGLLYNIPWMGLHEIIDEEVVGATQLSLVTASISTLICGVIGAPLALTLCKVLDRSRLRGAGSLLYAITLHAHYFLSRCFGPGAAFLLGPQRHHRGGPVRCRNQNHLHHHRRHYCPSFCGPTILRCQRRHHPASHPPGIRRNCRSRGRKSIRNHLPGAAATGCARHRHRVPAFLRQGTGRIRCHRHLRRKRQR